jgi:hypothetical protein
MNKIFNRKGYNFKEDLESGLIAIFWVAVIMFSLSAMAWGIDKIDQHKETATVIDAKPLVKTTYDSEGVVISVQALDEQVVTFETADGNTWEYMFDYDNDREIKPQDKAVLTFKEYENADVTDDEIVNLKKDFPQIKYITQQVDCKYSDISIGSYDAKSMAVHSPPDVSKMNATPLCPSVLKSISPSNSKPYNLTP